MEKESKTSTTRCPCCGGIQNVSCKPKLDPLPHRCARMGNKEALCGLMMSGVDVNLISEVDYATPLHRAAESGSVECAQVLVAHGALLNLTDSSGKTALHIAAESGHVNFVGFLLEKNAKKLCRRGCRKCSMFCKLVLRKKQKEDESKNVSPAHHINDDEEEEGNDLDKLDFMAELEKLRPALGNICVSKEGEIITI
ncbi:unnamed protein product [Blepharisma stoltei]|uniref:Uncharacterized protein n=1 Tax=Blepharisma stoltei TaxID=1481888 RepID=A0AAU9JRI4_9CILI|nr:unnamed protein product [Blepharisma stoltei]